MEERRLRIGSFFEWLAAAAGVAGLIWLLSVPVQRLIGPRVDAALVELSHQRGVSLLPMDDQKLLTDDDRAAAVRIGVKDNHQIAIDD